MSVHVEHAGLAGGACELGEPAVGAHAQRRSGALRMRGVDHDAAGAAVHDPELGPVAGAHRAAEALDRDLEVHDRALAAVGLRNPRDVGDDPLVGVGRDVRPGLVGLADVEREARREEWRLLLGGRQIRRRRDVTADHAGELLTVGVDEARLADAARVEPLQIAELVRDVGQVAAVAAHLLPRRAGLAQHSGERGTVRGQQHDRVRALEVVVQRVAVLVRVGTQRAIELREPTIMVELRHAHRGRDETHPDDQGG